MGNRILFQAFRKAPVFAAMVLAASTLGCVKEINPWKGMEEAMVAPASFDGALPGVAVAVQATPVPMEQLSWEQKMDLARAADKEKRRDDARLYFEAAIKDAEKFGVADPRYQSNLVELAYFYYYGGSYDEGVVVFEKIVKVREQAKGPESLELAGDLLNLGNVYAFLNRFPEAEAQFKRAIMIREKAHADETKEMVQLLKDYAAMLRKATRDAEADPIEARVEALQSKVK